MGNYDFSGLILVSYLDTIKYFGHDIGVNAGARLRECLLFPDQIIMMIFLTYTLVIFV